MKNFPLSRWVGRLTEYCNAAFLAILKFFEDFPINPKSAECAQKDIPPFLEYFLNRKFCFAEYTIISLKIDEIWDELSNPKLSSWMILATNC